MRRTESLHDAHEQEVQASNRKNNFVLINYADERMHNLPASSQTSGTFRASHVVSEMKRNEQSSDSVNDLRQYFTNVPELGGRTHENRVKIHTFELASPIRDLKPRDMQKAGHQRSSTTNNLAAHMLGVSLGKDDLHRAEFKLKTESSRIGDPPAVGKAILSRMYQTQAQQNFRRALIHSKVSRVRNLNEVQTALLLDDSADIYKTLQAKRNIGLDPDLVKRLEMQRQDEIVLHQKMDLLKSKMQGHQTRNDSSICDVAVELESSLNDDEALDEMVSMASRKPLPSGIKTKFNRTQQLGQK